MNTRDAKSILEAALLTSPAPLDLGEMTRLFEAGVGADTVRVLLEELRGEWSHRAVELIALPTGWRFQSKAQFAPYLARLNPERAPKYSRAVMETLAIIAYRQPVTRGDIEDIRGVAVSPQIVKTLEEREWIEAIGHRDSPGRPAIFATTKNFLADLGLRSLDELPQLEELAQAMQAALPVDEPQAPVVVLPDVAATRELGFNWNPNQSRIEAPQLKPAVIEIPSPAQPVSLGEWPHPLPVPR